MFENNMRAMVLSIWSEKVCECVDGGDPRVESVSVKHRVQG